jgi:predicted  nucleic acid-binding Zn-ribbon protein
MNNTFSLYRLQQLDSQRIERLKRIKQIDQIIASDKAVLKAKSVVQKADDALTSNNNELENVRLKVEEKTLKLKLTQAKLFGGKINAPKELQDLQAESEALRRTIKSLEDEQMVLLEVNDVCQDAKKAAEAGLQQLLNKKASENSLLLGEREKLKMQLPKINSQRESLKSQLDEKLLKEYDALFKSKGGVAVAEIFDGSCKACGVELSPTDIQQAANPNVLMKCKSCGRILYKM